MGSTRERVEGRKWGINFLSYIEGNQELLLQLMGQETDIDYYVKS